MKYSDLVVLSYRCSLNLVDSDGHIIPNDSNDIDCVKYISQDLEIDLNKKRYRTIFGVDHVNNYIKNGFIIKKGWNPIGQSVISHDRNDGLLGIYDYTNFDHLQSLVIDVVEANTDHNITDE